MIWWRLDQEWDGMPIGSTISDDKYQNIYYLDKPLFTPIQDFELVDMIEYKDECFCIENGIDKFLFYNNKELSIFLAKYLQK